MFQIAVAVITCINGLTIIAFLHQYHLLQFLIGQVFVVYACIGVAFSAIGLIGVATRKPKLISVFASYLVVDSFVAGVYRYLVADIFLSTAWDDIEGHPTSKPTWNPDNSDLDLIASFQRFRNGHVAEYTRRRSSQVPVEAIQFAVMLLLVLCSVAQGLVAKGMRSYANEMDLQMKLEKWQSPELFPDQEKAALMARDLA